MKKRHLILRLIAVIAGILKNPSSSSYNGTVQEGSDSGVPGAAHSFSYDSEGSADHSGAPGRVPPVSLNPDPTAQYRDGRYPSTGGYPGQQRYSGGPVDHSSSTESEQAVMAHMPQQARAPQKQRAVYQNQGYAKETDIDGDIDPGMGGAPRATSTGRREMQQYGDSSFDAYDSSGSTPKKQQPHKQMQLPKQKPRWGQNRERPPITPPATARGTTPPPLRTSGVFNEGYEVDAGQVSTVTEQYTQYTTPQRQQRTTTTTTTYQYSTTPPASPATHAINTSSVSTEV